MGARAGGGEGKLLGFNGDRISVLQEEKVLEMDVGDGCTAMRL